MPKCVDILVWDHAGSGGKTGGHAAMMVSGQLSGNERQEADHSAGKTYISWWPDGGGLKKEKDTLPFTMRHGGAHTVLSDAREEISQSTKEALNNERFPPRPNQRNLGMGTQSIPTHDGGFNPISAMTDDLQNQWYEMLTEREHCATQWVQFPNQSIPIFLAGQHNLGLNAHAMLTWWEMFRTAHKNDTNRNTGYKFISKKFNCASVVMRALIAGEAAFFVKPPNNWLYFSPADVVIYARKLEIAVTKASLEYERYFHEKLSWQGKNRTLLRTPRGLTDLPTRQQWEDMSNANVKWGLFKRGSRNAIRYATRGGESVAIDNMLDEYHSLLPWQNWMGAALREQKMFNMWEQTAAYLARKPNGDRKDAMLILAQTIMNVRADKAPRVGGADWFE